MYSLNKHHNALPGDAAYTTYSATGKKLNQNRSSEGQLIRYNVTYCV